jgi:type IV pilus assembly protein PilW
MARSRTPARVLQTGFTLVELMVSMVLGLFIVLALVTLLINVNRNNGEMSKTNRVIENGRFALQLLEADVSHAGYWGGFLPQYDDLSLTSVPSDAPDRVPDPCATYSTTTWNATPSTLTGGTVSYVSDLIGVPVQAYEIPSVVPSPTLSVCATRVVSPQASTDVLFVRHLDTESCTAGAGGCPATAGELYFQMNQCQDSTSPGYSTTTYVFGSVTSAFTLYGASCTPALPAAGASTGTHAELRKYVSNLYYVRNYSVTAGDGIPTLVRSQFSGGQYQAEQALIEGVQGFRVELGVDSLSATGAAVNYAQAVSFPNPAKLITPSNRGDGYPDGTYVHCTTATPCTVSQLTNAVVVKLYVLVRSPDATVGYTDTKTYNLGSTTLGPFNDSYKRHLFVQTVRLTNVSMRRETPPT